MPKRPTSDPLLTIPRHLSHHMKTWVGNIVDRYLIEPEDFVTLVLAAEAWDEAENARSTLVKKGTTFKDRFGSPRNRPEVAQLRDARIAFARLMRQLGLGDEEGPMTENKSRPRSAPCLLRKED
jgi:phage terminase small subunit